MINLEYFDVQEMNINKQRRVNGGFMQYAILAVTYIAWEIANNPRSHMEALQEGFDSYKSQLMN